MLLKKDRLLVELVIEDVDVDVDVNVSHCPRNWQAKVDLLFSMIEKYSSFIRTI